MLACRVAGADRPAAAAPEIAIEIVGDDSFEEWFTVAIDSFANMDGSGSAADAALPREELERLLREAMGPQSVEGLTRYIARLDGEPAGEAALHVDEGLALLAGSGTVPHLRGRGVQKALVARRLDDARREGCDMAVVVTAPGSGRRKTSCAAASSCSIRGRFCCAELVSTTATAFRLKPEATRW